MANSSSVLKSALVCQAQFMLSPCLLLHELWSFHMPSHHTHKYSFPQFLSNWSD